MSKALTRAERRLVDASVAIQERDPLEEGVLVFSAKALASATLPYNRPKQEQLENGCWIRRSGRWRLWAQGGPDGIPYGTYPRLFFIYAVTEAVRSKSPEIELGRFQTFCDRLGIDRSMGKRGQGRAMMDQVKRILWTRWGFDEDGQTGKPDLKRGFEFATDAVMWWDLEAKSESLFTSRLTLDSRMYEAVQSHPVPMDMRAVSALKSSPIALDIYQWLAYRMYSLKSPTLIPWDSLQLQFGCEFARTRDFRSKFRKAMQKVSVVYPEARITDQEKGLLLRPSPTPVRPIRIRAPNLALVERSS